MAMSVKHKRLHIGYPHRGQVIKAPGFVALGTVPAKKGGVAGVIITKKGEVIPGKLMAGPPNWQLLFFQGPQGLPVGQYLLVVSYWLEKPQIATRRFEVKKRITRDDDGDFIYIFYPLEYDGTDDTSCCTPNLPVYGCATCANVNVACTNQLTVAVDPTTWLWSATFGKMMAGDYSLTATDPNGVASPANVSDVHMIDCDQSSSKKKINKR